MVMTLFPATHKGTLVTKDPNLNGTEVTILRTTKDGKKYIVETSSGKVKVLPSQLIFNKHTPVSMTYDGETFTVFIDSFHEKTNSYRVFMMTGATDEDPHTYTTVDSDAVSVSFTDASRTMFADEDYSSFRQRIMGLS